MSGQTQKGKAFEYACLKAIQEELRVRGYDVLVDVGPAYATAKSAYEHLHPGEIKDYDDAAKTGAKMLFPLEPEFLYGGGALTLSLNTDSAGKSNKKDVRDLLCLRSEDNWEIGISCKHNHEALKHPRITKNLDFGTDWVGYPCSTEFMSTAQLIVEPLHECRTSGINWDAVPDKWDAFYVPLLKAHLDEIIRLCAEHNDVPAKLLTYFFGAKDFYKLISNESGKTTRLIAFNMSDTLSCPVGKIKPVSRMPKIKLPTRLIEGRLKEETKTTIQLTFDGGWVVDMRLHNKDKAATHTSLAWDVSLAGLPHGVYQNERPWYE